MALAAGDTVLVTSALVVAGRPAPPLLGSVESTNPWIIAWENGQRASYVAVDPLNKLVPAVDTSFNALLYRYVRTTSGIGDGQRFEGYVVAVYGLENNAGTPIGDFVVIRLNTGQYMLINASVAELVPNR